MLLFGHSVLSDCDCMDCNSPGSPVLHYLPEFAQIHGLQSMGSQELDTIEQLHFHFQTFMPIESVMPSNHLILCCPLRLPPSNFSSIAIFSSESALHIRWPKCWHFSFSISPSNEHSGLISFRIDWFDLLVLTYKGFLPGEPHGQYQKANIMTVANNDLWSLGWLWG